MKSIIQIMMICLFLVSCKKDEIIMPANILIDGPDKITANYQYSTVTQYATTIDSTIKFKSVSSTNVNIDGTAKSWTYKYGSSISPFNCYYFIANYLSIGFDSVSVPTMGDAFVTHTWINSSVAMNIAENNGGKQFRLNNQYYIITASLGEPVVPNPSTFWWITYRSTIDKNIYLIITINATSGVVK